MIIEWTVLKTLWSFQLQDVVQVGSFAILYYFKVEHPVHFTEAANLTKYKLLLLTIITNNFQQIANYL